MSRKREAASACTFALRSTSAKEHLRLEKRLRRREQKFRKRYREIHGKAVDWISHSFEDGSLYVGIRFKDKTHFSLRFSPQVVHDQAHLSDVRAGDYEIVRQYHRGRH